jgi:Ca-activated chloride channel family protein
MGAGHSVTALYELVPAGARLPKIPSIDPLKYQSGPVVPDLKAQDAGPRTQDSSEWLTVKLRYKQPQSDTSVPFDQPVTPAQSARDSEDLRFATAVAAFGMVLRESEYRGDASYPMALQLARSSRGGDPHGHRAELIKLIELASALGVATTREQ